MDPWTVFISIAGSSGAAAIIANVFSLPKSARGELNQMRKDLTSCEGDCLQARDDALRARRETDNWRVRVERLEDEIERHRREADHWRDRWQKEVGERRG